MSRRPTLLAFFAVLAFVLGFAWLLSVARYVEGLPIGWSDGAFTAILSLPGLGFLACAVVFERERTCRGSSAELQRGSRRHGRPAHR